MAWVGLDWVTQTTNIEIHTTTGKLHPPHPTSCAKLKKSRKFKVSPEHPPANGHTVLMRA